MHGNPANSVKALYMYNGCKTIAIVVVVVAAVVLVVLLITLKRQKLFTYSKCDLHKPRLFCISTVGRFVGNEEY